MQSKTKNIKAKPKQHKKQTKAKQSESNTKAEQKQTKATRSDCSPNVTSGTVRKLSLGMRGYQDCRQIFSLFIRCEISHFPVLSIVHMVLNWEHVHWIARDRKAGWVQTFEKNINFMSFILRRKNKFRAGITLIQYSNILVAILIF